MLTSELTVHMLKRIVRGRVCCLLILDSSFIYSFKVIIVTLLDAVAIGDVLTASNNDVKPLYSLHDYYSLSRLERIKKTRQRLLVMANVITCFPPEIPRDCFYLLILKHVQRWRTERTRNRVWISKTQANNLNPN